MKDKQPEVQTKIPDINKLIHEPARLMIMTYLYVVESADAVYLQRQTGLTWGNISSHLKKLEEAGYLEVKKDFVNRKPHTSLKLTNKGRKAFEEYRANMEQVFDKIPNK